MRSFKRFVVCSSLVLFASILQANGQACGRYYINVAVQDEAGKPIKNATVTLKAIDTDETEGKDFAKDPKDPSRFQIDFSEGHSFRFFHKIIVSAPGFATAENLAKFVSCGNRGVVVKLSKAASAPSAVWEFENSVNVEVTAGGDKNIDGVKLTVIDGQNRSHDVPVQIWFAIFDLPNGEYTFRFEAPGYETLNQKVDLTPLADKSVKVELKHL